MPDVDNNFGGSLGLDFRKWWRHVQPKNKSNGVVRMYVTTSVTHKPELRIDLLTFMQIVNNFALVMLVS